MASPKPAAKPVFTSKPGAAVLPPVRTGPPTPRSLRGFRDLLPADQLVWRHVRQVADELATGYGFGWIDPPVLEDVALFSRAAGRHSDIVTKEMFSFTDTGGENVALRPEFTPGVVRAYIEHGLLNNPQPIRVAYWGPAFRRERPQHGRYRQFTQFGVEVIGSGAAVVDAQLVAMFYHLCEQLGIAPVSIQLNSLGCATCRAEYRTELVNYYKPKRRYLCEDCKKRLSKNPLRLLDCKNANCQQHIAGAPQLLDWVDDACKKHFMAVVEYLDGMEIPYVLNPYLVRGLDYYTRTVFEVWPTADAAGSTAALGGGGRYDDLLGLMGGNPTPAAGFAVGIDRLILRLKEMNVSPAAPKAPDVFVAQIGEQAKIKALKLFERLRREGFAVSENFSKDSLKAQLEIANKQHARYAIIIGQKEVLDGTVLIRDMDGGVQEIIGYDKISGDLERKLKNGAASPIIEEGAVAPVEGETPVTAPEAEAPQPKPSGKKQRSSSGSQLSLPDSDENLVEGI
ncbi:MAG: histidyl-tRNA synthetase [Parcubacteria group bacterium Gr01-1014_31]|nr:MAG: histidyl-tRNA synthetase [Parcubacteria group bacterium Gr01-1014_31]